MLRHFQRSLNFGLVNSGTVVIWGGSDHRCKSSCGSVIALNCASQVIIGEYCRAHESVFIPYRIMSACVIVGWVT